MKNIQYFGKYDTNFDREFLIEGYLYCPIDNEEISVEEFKQLIKTKKDKKKNIAGTIFMHNPYAYPKGYDKLKKLADQEFDFDQGFCEIEVEREMTLFKNAINGYDGQLIEVRYLFNLNIENIDRDELFIAFNGDLDRLHTNQLTQFDKTMNYIDVYSDFSVNGKFIFFAWGNRFTNRTSFVNIRNYAFEIFNKCVQTQKKIAYVYRASQKEEFARENIQFLHPIQMGRFKANMPEALKQAFITNPPLPAVFIDQ